MRITNRMISDGMLYDLQSSAGRLDEAQRQLTSGKRLNRPSDDPAGADRALTLQGDIAARDARVGSTGDALDWLGATDTAIGTATDLLRRAQELAVQGANDGLTNEQRQSMAQEINEILGHLVQVANTNLRGQRIFAGLRTDADPFAAVGNPPTSVTWHGDSGVIQREVDSNTTIGINVIGGTVFSPLFDQVIQLRDALNDGDVPAIRAAGLTGLSQQLDALLGVRSGVGSKVRRLESLQDVHALRRQQSATSLSGIEDTDYEQAITALTLRETAYKAALATSARSVPQSLFDFLR